MCGRVQRDMCPVCVALSCMCPVCVALSCMCPVCVALSCMCPVCVALFCMCPVCVVLSCMCPVCVELRCDGVAVNGGIYDVKQRTDCSRNRAPSPERSHMNSGLCRRCRLKLSRREFDRDLGTLTCECPHGSIVLKNSWHRMRDK